MKRTQPLRWQRADARRIGWGVSLCLHFGAYGALTLLGLAGSSRFLTQSGAQAAAADPADASARQQVQAMLQARQQLEQARVRVTSEYAQWKAAQQQVALPGMQRAIQAAHVAQQAAQQAQSYANVAALQAEQARQQISLAKNSVERAAALMAWKRAVQEMAQAEAEAQQEQTRVSAALEESTALLEYAPITSESGEQLRQSLQAANKENGQSQQAQNQAIAALSAMQPAMQAVEAGAAVLAQSEQQTKQQAENGLKAQQAIAQAQQAVQRAEPGVTSALGQFDAANRHELDTHAPGSHEAALAAQKRYQEQINKRAQAETELRVKQEQATAMQQNAGRAQEAAKQQRSDLAQKLQTGAQAQAQAQAALRDAMSTQQRAQTEQQTLAQQLAQLPAGQLEEAKPAAAKAATADTAAKSAAKPADGKQAETNGKNADAPVSLSAARMPASKLSAASATAARMPAENAPVPNAQAAANAPPANKLPANSSQTANSKTSNSKVASAASASVAAPPAPVTSALVPSVDHLNIGELYDAAVQAEKANVETYRQIRAYQTTMTQRIPLERALADTDATPPLRPPLSTDSSGGIALFERSLSAAQRAQARQQIAAMSGLAAQMTARIQPQTSDGQLSASQASAPGSGGAHATEMKSSGNNSTGSLPSATVSSQAEGTPIAPFPIGADIVASPQRIALAHEEEGRPAKDLSGDMRAMMEGSGDSVVRSVDVPGTGESGSSANVRSMERAGSAPTAQKDGQKHETRWSNTPEGNRGSAPPAAPPIAIQAVPGRTVGNGTWGAGWMYVDAWHAIGPFPNPRRQNMNKPFPPEAGVDLDAAYPGKDGRVLHWKWLQSPTPMLTPNDAEEYGVYYGYTELWFDAAADMWIAIGSDDKSTLWIENQLVWISSDVLKGWRIDEGLRRVHFRKGLNRILFRLENGWRGMGFSLCLCLKPTAK